MENYIGIIALTLIIMVSRRSGLPIVILSFYIAYMLFEIQFYDSYISDHAWYLSNIIMDMFVLFACVLVASGRESYIKTIFIYMLYVAWFYLLPDMMVFMSINSTFDYQAEGLYDFIMNFAVPIDILFALIGSDNKLSRMLNRDG